MKKGFTLIELLAVIIVLAVVALITTPIVLNVVDSAKKSAAASSVNGYVTAVDYAIMEEMFSNGNSAVTTVPTTINYKGDAVTCTGGTVEKNHFKATSCTVNGYTCTFASGKDTVSADNCTK